MPRLRPARVERRRFLLSWLFFTAMGCLWALATPLMAVPDEPAHTVYAAAAVRGQIWAEAEGHHTVVTVPAGLAGAHAVGSCFVFPTEEQPACPLVDEPGMAVSDTTAGRYPPAYYFYAGLPTLVTDGALAVYLMRALTALLVGALLAAAFCTVLSLGRRALPIAGFALATTPMLFFFSGAVNPQAPEIAAAICLWVSGAVLLGRMRQDPNLMPSWGDPHCRRVLAAVAVLTVVRPMSLLWLALITLALLAFFADRTTLLRLVRARIVLAAVPVLALTAGTTLAWVVFRDALMQQDVTTYAGFSTRQALMTSVAKLDDEFMQMIGTFGWLSIPAPGWALVAFPAALGALAALALPAFSLRERLWLAGLAALVVLIPVAMELSSYRESAFAWQGRYTLPLAVGIPLLMGLRPNREPATGRAGLATTVIAVMASIHIASFAGPVVQYLRGIDSLWNGSIDGWNPPVPGVFLVLTFAGLIMAGAWSARRLAATAGSPPVDPPPPADGAGDADRPIRPVGRWAQAASTPSM